MSFKTDAEDIFIASANYNWSVLENMVVGKLGYDNFLVDEAYHNPNTSLVDVHDTLKIIHIGPDKSGEHVESETDPYVNRRIANSIRRHPFDHGYTSSAKLITMGDCILKRQGHTKAFCYGPEQA